jgi:hypothetical protein
MSVPQRPINGQNSIAQLPPGAMQQWWDQCFKTTTGLVALAGGGKTGATKLSVGTNVVATVATAADSVILPPGDIGSRVIVINSGANALQIFGAGSDTIDGVATGTGNAQAAAERATYICVSKTAAGVAAWNSINGVAV